MFTADVKGDLSGLSTPGDAGGPAAKQPRSSVSHSRRWAIRWSTWRSAGSAPACRSGQRSQISAGATREGAGLERDPRTEFGARVPLRRPKRTPAPRPLRPARTPDLPRIRRWHKNELQGIGGLASQTVGVLLRALVGLEDGGGNEFFGEPQFDVNDLLRTAPDGRGVISCLELPGVQDKPKLFSTALMWLLARALRSAP